MKLKWILLTAASISLFSSCSKDKNTTPSGPDPVTQGNKVTMKFENYVGTQPLKMDGTTYTNAHGDQFTVDLYKYYISNVKLVNQDGTEFAEPESYHLIDQNDNARWAFTLSNAPAGTYTKMKVMLGVDPARNVSGAQTGDLDPILGMFWNWNSGYIMAKVQGTSPQAGSLGFSFHLGGFSAPYSVLHEIELTFPSPLVITATAQPSVTIKSDVLKWFEAPNMIDFSVLNQVGAQGESAQKISDNYALAFSVTRVDN